MLAIFPRKRSSSDAIFSTLWMNWISPRRVRADTIRHLYRISSAECPAFEVLNESERMQLIESPDAETRAAAAHSFFNQELDPKTRATLFRLAQSDPTPRFAHAHGNRSLTLPRTRRFEAPCSRS